MELAFPCSYKANATGWNVFSRCLSNRLFRFIFLCALKCYRLTGVNAKGKERSQTKFRCIAYGKQNLAINVPPGISLLQP